MIQRFKEDVLRNDLRGKDDVVVFCPLSSIQTRLYEHILSLPDFDNCRCVLVLYFFIPDFSNYFVVVFRYYGNPCPNCDSGKPRSNCCSAIYTIPLCRDATGNQASEPLRMDTRAHIWRKLHKKQQKAATATSDKSSKATADSSESVKAIGAVVPVSDGPVDITPPGTTTTTTSNTTTTTVAVAVASKDPSLLSEYDECPRCPTCVSLPCVTILLKIASHPMLLQVIM